MIKEEACKILDLENQFKSKEDEYRRILETIGTDIHSKKIEIESLKRNLGQIISPLRSNIIITYNNKNYCLFVDKNGNAQVKPAYLLDEAETKLMINKLDSK